jgi:hypothetical protein
VFQEALVRGDNKKYLIMILQKKIPRFGARTLDYYQISDKTMDLGVWAWIAQAGGRSAANLRVSACISTAGEETCGGGYGNGRHARAHSGRRIRFQSRPGGEIRDLSFYYPEAVIPAAVRPATIQHHACPALFPSFYLRYSIVHNNCTCKD